MKNRVAEREKRQIEKERLLLLIQHFDLTGKREALTEILFKLVERA